MHRPFVIPESLFPFRSHWLEVDGVPIHFVDEGSGPPVLLIHGNFLWSFSDRRLVEELRKSHRCIAVDLAGMGMSGKAHASGMGRKRYTYAAQSATVARVVEALELEEITFLSFDHGGPVGFGVAVEHPERFARIVVANSWIWSLKGYRASRIWSMLASRSANLLRRLMLNKKRWLFEAPEDLRDERVWQASTAPYQRASDFLPMATLAGELTRARAHFRRIQDGMARLSRIDFEILWATGPGGLFPEFVREDGLLDRWRNALPDAPVTLLPGAPYYPMITRPREELIGLLRG